MDDFIIPIYLTDRAEAAIEQCDMVNELIGTAVVQTHVNTTASQYLTLAFNHQDVTYTERRHTVAKKVVHLRRQARENGARIRRVTFEPHDGPLSYEFLPQRQIKRRQSKDGLLMETSMRSTSLPLPTPWLTTAP
ncbi:uncharacterized protein LOC132194742 [Neocloeon triangulifer]|uniref:uncharacterized protein LOC132194742 n=1 Tax=Neocloeon triangulifer TaxID=2078957 RepID=UPI00286EC1A1|nr:uncharacterized protein LOC132194742 [Neocloeon triangulifer]XP_059472204.1 uncharacterized protein LOC132194742 [Neocloeon triangulifer]XP_059472205.1 uncharacterized protein LOC132194742 [Neocloeon triangulifer]XP_059472206.1 uncharacterized protein LOC132194742 [Neocloeon triangulifer]